MSDDLDPEDPMVQEFLDEENPPPEVIVTEFSTIGPVFLVDDDEEDDST